MHSELIQSLMNPARYPHAVERVERVETHVSWVLLAGEFAYKIKKPVDFGFLDFSTLAARRHFCQEELRLNRRHAPAIYLDLVPITGSARAPGFDGGGEVIEYAVRMRRFDQRLGFDRLLAEQALEPVHIDQLAAELALLHQDAERAAAGSEFGSAEAVIGPMRDNFPPLRAQLEGTGRLQRLDWLAQWTEVTYQRLQPRIIARQADGHVRECHGDAHLGNVVLYQGRAMLFDCLEFSPELRWTDTMADLAFTVMDLSDRGAEGLGWRLLDAYLTSTGDHAGLDLLDFYTVYRAMVRAKIAALNLAAAELETEREGCLAAVDAYLDLAGRVATRPEPMLLLTCGVSGSGKSWLSERLVESSGLIRLRSDVERKRLHGLTASAHTGSAVGEGLYSAAASERTYRQLAGLAEQVLRAGLPVVVDATFLKRRQRRQFQALAGRLQTRFGILSCHASTDLLEQRVTTRRRHGQDPSEAGLTVLHAQLEGFEAVGPDEQSLMLDTAAPDALVRAQAWIDRLRSGAGRRGRG